MKTVLVLGAGASADFGLPLGDALYDQATSLLSSFVAEWYDKEEKDSFWNYQRAVSFVQGHKRCSHLLPHVLRNLPNGSQQINIQPIESLLGAMKVAPAYSLDTLALEYPEHTDIFRTLCATLIIEALAKRITRDRSGSEIRQFELRSLSNPKDQSTVSNWIHLFCSMARNEISAGTSSGYGVVSFNYDRLFEKVGGAVWRIPTRTLGDFNSIFDIRYPHGKIHWDTDSRGMTQFEVQRSNIIFAHNKPGDYANDGAADLVLQAEKLIFLGFHFSPENISMLRLKECRPKLVIYQNYADNRGLDNRVKSIGFETVQKFTGSISNAILQGELGELPS